uniref:Uncharacterized protein n=1 Tax=Arundo donax TaxID=35708 RepID=A0A0A8XZP9_ARUDO
MSDLHTIQEHNRYNTNPSPDNPKKSIHLAAKLAQLIAQAKNPTQHPPPHICVRSGTVATYQHPAV